MKRNSPLMTLFALAIGTLILTIPDLWTTWTWNQSDHRIPITQRTTTAAGANTTPYTPPTCAASQCNCKDFPTQAEAQAFFRWSETTTGIRDKHGLDADDDGQACEALPFK